MIDFVRVGIKISDHRKKLKMTQGDLADQLFVTRQLVSKWELGIGVPTIDTFLELSKLFGVSFEDLLCLDDKVEVDESNLFANHDRLLVLNHIINGRFKVSLPQVIHQFTSTERMILLKAIKKRKLKVLMSDLLPRLSATEKTFLKREEVKYDFKKSSK